MPPVPPIGSVRVGELLVDAQSKALWLGVAPTIDPAQAILISDIVSLQQSIDDLNDTLIAYIDAGLAAKSDVGHLHVAADITDFSSAVGDITPSSVPAYCIIIYTGSLAAIPTNFVKCEGQTISVPGGGTFQVPDLRDKFVVCQGVTYPYKQVNAGGNTLAVGYAGNHNHSAVTGFTTLTVAQIPAHNHGYSDPGHAHSVYDPGHAHVNAGANHRHDIPVIDFASGITYQITSGAGAYITGASGGVTGYTDVGNTSPAGTGVAIYGAGIGITIANAGGGGGHQHFISDSGDHTHGITGSATPPWYALAYIMRIPT